LNVLRAYIQTDIRHVGPTEATPLRVWSKQSPWANLHIVRNRVKVASDARARGYDGKVIGLAGRTVTRIRSSCPVWHLLHLPPQLIIFASQL